jgi:hypothetical protein
MSAVIGSNLAARIAGFARAKVLEKKATRAGRYPRPLYDFAQRIKRLTQFPKGEVLEPLKGVAGNLSGQSWAGSDSMQAAQQIQNGMMLSFNSANFFDAIYWPFDDLRKASGVTILPNDNGKTLDARVVRRDKGGERIIYDRMSEDTESFLDRMIQLIDIRMQRQAATAKDLVGVNSMIQVNQTGNYAGISRERVPEVQNVCFAGNDGNGTTPAWMGARGTTGTSGTLLTQLEEFMTQIRTGAAMSGLPKGKFLARGGRGFIKKLKAQMRVDGLQFNVEAANMSSKLNLMITDERLGLGGPDVEFVWDPTLDYLDVIATSEKGLGVSQISVTFGGTTWTRTPTAVAYVTAAGAIDKIVVTDPGAGCVAPGSVTVTLGNAGSGISAAFQAYHFASSSGTGKTQVDADDSRIGSMDYVEVTTAGSGYPVTGVASNFTDRLYVHYEPSWKYLVQEGLDEYLSIPADDPRARKIEQQFDHTDCLVCNCPRANGVLVAASS